MTKLSSVQIAERFVIGACLIDPNAYPKISDRLEARHFSNTLHRQVWSAIRDVAEKAAIDYRVVLSHLPEDIESGESTISTLGYLQLLMDEGLEGGEIEAFADVIISEYVIRTAIKTIDAARKKLLSRDEYSPTIVEDLAQKLGALTTTVGDIEEMTIGKAAQIAADRAANAYQGRAAPGIGTGLSSLDSLIGRMMPSELIFITGDPGGGKSSLAQQIAISAASGLDLAENPKHVLFFQLDMGVVGMAQRQLAGDANVEAARIREGNINQAEYGRVFDAANRLQPLPLNIVSMSSPRVSRIRNRCMTAKRQGKLDLVVIDHLLCIKHDNPRVYGLDAYDDIVSIVKGIARDCDIPVILLTQRTRTSMQRDDPRPRLTDSYGGGGAERNADWGIGIWNEAEFMKGRRPSDVDEKKVLAWEDRYNAVKGQAELLLLKARFKAPNISRTVKWIGAATRFADIDG